VKQIVGKFKIGKTQFYDILKWKSDIKLQWFHENEIKKDWKRKHKCVSEPELNGNLLITETKYGPVGFH
jgi:hypothetical protein